MIARSHSRAAVLALAACVAVAGCGNDRSAVPPTPPPVVSQPSVSSGPLRSVPADFPIDVHLPTASYTISNLVRTGPSMVLTLHSSQAAARLYTEYVLSMKAAGWTEATAMQGSSSQSVMAFRKGGRVLTVSLIARPNSSDGGTDVSLQLGPLEPGR